ncbi:MAG TPA: globin family protein [Candidatus Macondimonas sp.]|nr:globin family protein [Candidatus Macondimonas sp.]
MKPEEINLVQSTWAQVVPIKEQAAELFYGRLFELDPSLEPLFKGDMKAQGQKLMAMIGTAVGGLTQPETIVPALRDLGRRHVGYGVQAQHYDTVGAALLWTLEKGLGPAFTPETRQAWAETYDLVAGVMKEAAAPSR